MNLLIEAARTFRHPTENEKGLEGRAEKSSCYSTWNNDWKCLTLSRHFHNKLIITQAEYFQSRSGILLCKTRDIAVDKSEPWLSRSSVDHSKIMIRVKKNWQRSFSERLSANHSNARFARICKQSLIFERFLIYFLQYFYLKSRRDLFRSPCACGMTFDGYAKVKLAIYCKLCWFIVCWLVARLFCYTALYFPMKGKKRLEQDGSYNMRHYYRWILNVCSSDDCISH